MRSPCVCRRPAVSTISVSHPRARAASTASKATDAGSAPAALPRTRSPPAPPRPELVDGAGPEGVARRQEHAPPLPTQPAGQLADGRGLPDAVHPTTSTTASSPRGGSASWSSPPGGEDPVDLLLHRAPELLLGGDLPGAGQVLHVVHQPERGLHPEIAGQEDLFEALQRAWSSPPRMTTPTSVKRHLLHALPEALLLLTRPVQSPRMSVFPAFGRRAVLPPRARATPPPAAPAPAAPGRPGPGHLRIPPAPWRPPTART
jgi:hypothetical protein